MSNIQMHVTDLPGHTRGGVGYYFPDDGILIVGDTLFQASYGRVDFPGGNASDLTASIAKVYDMNMADTTVVLHGHGMHTTIGWLKQNNPYFTKTPVLN